MELPPEVCTLHVGLKGKLCRGAMRLPSVLYSLEMSLVAAELRNNIGPPISCFKVCLHSSDLLFILMDPIPGSYAVLRKLLTLEPFPLVFETRTFQYYLLNGNT